MFDAYSEELFDALPQLEGLSSAEARRELSRAYLAVIELRTGVTTQEQVPGATIGFVRRLADALEVNLLLRDGVSEVEEVACAFVAGEALSLLSELLDLVVEVGADHRPRFHRSPLLTRVEAALLYLIASYDASAATIVRDIPAASALDDAHARAAEWAMDQLLSLCSLRLSPPPVPEGCGAVFRSASALVGADVEADTLGRLYQRLGWAVARLVGWLGGFDEDGAAASEDALQRLIDALSPPASDTDTGILGMVGVEHARICHIARLVLRAGRGVRGRSVLHRIPLPPRGDQARFRSYLLSRARGGPEGRGSRPVLWPSVQSFVRTFLEEGTPHAVAAMPTGSGKSFLGELAIAHCRDDGWCLYLVPTNALATQVRTDLRRQLRELEVRVQAFIGDQDYTSLEEDRVSEVAPGTIAVMTPEKCALALRLGADLFKNISLVVFDECHLLGERTSGRGLTAELVLTQIMILSPSCRFLLMSAMVENPGDLKDWLTQATTRPCALVAQPWKPTRSLRSAVAVDGSELEAGQSAARQQLAALPERRKNLAFSCSLRLVGALQGTWQTTDEPDYAILALPFKTEFKVHREKKGRRKNWVYSIDTGGWVNECAATLSKLLVNSGIQTLTFIPKSKHYPFSVAKDIQLNEVPRTQPGEKVGACHVLAEYELGVRSEPFALIARGIAVHTALMLETEKIAAEESFASSHARLMLATGTLAQGLNLPAVAVVIAGTDIGYAPSELPALVKQRRLAQLLNAAGRAGRAGFSNQGVVIAISNTPVGVEDYGTCMHLRNELDFMQERDNSVTVRSSLGTFLDLVAKQALRTDQAGPIELQAISVLGGGDEGGPPTAEVIRRSYGAFLRRQRDPVDLSDMGTKRLDLLRAEFTAAHGLPAWVPVASQRAGLDFWQTAALAVAFERALGTLTPELLQSSTMEWTRHFIRVLAHMAPLHLITLCSADDLSRASDRLDAAFEQMKVALEGRHGRLRDLRWTLPPGWIEAWEDLLRTLEPWMQGASISEIASLLTGDEVTKLSTSRNAGGQPIPKALTVTMGLFGELARLAGGLVAVVELILASMHHGQVQDVPPALACLPLAIKNGFDTPHRLAWFRFGLRLRRPAHFLAHLMPLAEGRYDDREARQTIEELKDGLLTSDIIVLRSDEQPLLAAIRTFMKVGG